jgi:hypothetical protein
MDGEPSYFKPRWEEARRTEPTVTPQLAETPTQHLDRILTTFGDTFHDARTLTPSPRLTGRRRTLVVIRRAKGRTSP